MLREHVAETLSVVEAGRRLGIGRCAAYRAANRGELPVIRIGGRLLVLRRSLERILAGQSVPGRRGKHRRTDTDGES